MNKKNVRTIDSQNNNMSLVTILCSSDSDNESIGRDGRTDETGIISCLYSCLEFRYRYIIYNFTEKIDEYYIPCNEF